AVSEGKIFGTGRGLGRARERLLAARRPVEHVGGVEARARTCRSKEPRDSRDRAQSRFRFLLPHHHRWPCVCRLGGIRRVAAGERQDETWRTAYRGELL